MRDPTVAIGASCVHARNYGTVGRNGHQLERVGWHLHGHAVCPQETEANRLRTALLVPRDQRGFGEQARIVGRSGDKTDVYLEVPILNGASKVWAVVRFSPPEIQGNQEVIRGRLVKGNVKRLDAVWRIEKVDDKTSVLSLELLIVPELPAPKSLLSSELKKAAGRAVNGARNEAEERRRR